MLSLFAQALTKRLDEQIVSLQEQAGGGGCADFPAYRHLCGRIFELENAKDIITQELQKYAREE